MQKIPNGGKKITINGTGINVISGYSTSWEREYSGDEFTTWDGRKRRILEGIRFRLSFSTYGMTPEEVSALNNALKPDEDTGEILLECDEFTGAVDCDNYSAQVQSANFYGEYHGANITLTAVESEKINGDGL